MWFSRFLLLSLLVISLLLSTPLAAQEEEEIQLELFSFKLSDLRITNTDVGLRVDYSWSLSVPQGNFILPDSSLTLTLWTVREVTGDLLNPQFETRNWGSVTSLTGVDFLISGVKSGTAGACDQLLSNDGFVVVVDISSIGVKNNQQISIPTQEYNVQLRRNSEVDCQTSKDSNEPMLTQVGKLGQIGQEIAFSFTVSDVKLQVLRAAFQGRLRNVAFLGFRFLLKSLDRNLVIVGVEASFYLSGFLSGSKEPSSRTLRPSPYSESFSLRSDLIKDENGQISEAFPLFAMNSYEHYANSDPTFDSDFTGCDLEFQDENFPLTISIETRLELVRIEQTPSGPNYQLSFANVVLNPAFEIEGSCK